MFKQINVINRVYILNRVLVGVLAVAGLSACTASHWSSKPTFNDVNLNGGHGEISQIFGGKPLSVESPLHKMTVGIMSATHKTGPCNGAIIDKNVVLSSARCIKSIPDPLVFFGEGPNNPEPTIKIKKTGYHPKIDNVDLASKESDWGDVALILLDGEIPKTHMVATMASKDFIPSAQKALIIAGYGTESRDQLSASPTLQFSIVHPFETQFGVSEFVTSQTEGKGICLGDVGSPAFTANEKGEFILVGIASRLFNPNEGDPCKALAIYSNVGFYQPFIETTKAVLLGAPESQAPSPSGTGESDPAVPESNPPTHLATEQSNLTNHSTLNPVPQVISESPSEFRPAKGEGGQKPPTTTKAI